MSVVFTPSKITRLFAVVAASLISLPLTARFTRSFLDISTSNLTLRFSLNEFPSEQTISTFYSALLLCSLVLFQAVEETLNHRNLVFICTLYVTSELSDVRLIAPSWLELL